MHINLFFVLLVACVIFGIKAVWTSRLQIAARKEIVGPLARRLGWCMIAMPAVAIASVAACVALLMLLRFDHSLAYGQGIIFGIVLVLLVCAYVANRLQRYGVPIKTGTAQLDWKHVDAKPSQPTFDFLQPSSEEARGTGADGTIAEPADAPESTAKSVTSLSEDNR